MRTANITVKVIFQDADFAGEQFPHSAAVEKAKKIVESLISEKAVQEKFAVGVEIS